MWKSLRGWVIVGGLALAVLILATGTSQAQVRVYSNSQAIVNPYYRVAPGLPLNQAAYNVRVLGRAYYNVPPWLYGYNPYPSPVIVTPPYAAPVYPYYNPYAYPIGPYSPYNLYTFP
jgi:hypothetical protein